MTTYTINSIKGSRTIDGTQADAIAAAIAMEEELQPAFGVTVELDGETVAEIRDGVADIDSQYIQRQCSEPAEPTHWVYDVATTAQSEALDAINPDRLADGPRPGTTPACLFDGVLYYLDPA